MAEIYDQAKVVYSDGPSSDPDNPPKSEIRALFKTVDEKVTFAAAGIRTFSSWTELAAVSTGLVAGQTSYVKGDAGTHTDPVVGGTVSNSGEFSWSTSPAGWERIGDVPVSAATVASDLADLDAVVVKLTGAQTVAGVKTFSDTPVFPDNSFTNAKLADMATARIKGRATAGTGDPEDLTAAQVRTMLNVADGATANDTDTNLKNRANHTGTQAISTVSGLQTALDGKQASDVDLTAFAGLSPAVDDVLQRKSGGWINRTPAQLKTDLALVKADVGLANADNVSAANLRDRSTHTGTQSADTLTDGTTNKAFLATERTKLAGIATGATANSTDATLLARANHTGTQAPSTVVGLPTFWISTVSATLRPGEAPEYFTSSPTGKAADRLPISIGAPAVSDVYGAVWEIPGADIPADPGYIDVYTLFDIPLGATEKLGIRWAIERATAAGDPIGDGVELKLQNLNKNGANVSNIRFGGPEVEGKIVAGGDAYPLPDALDVVDEEITISRTAADGVNYVAPATTRYVSVGVRIWKSTGNTRVAILSATDVTVASFGSETAAGVAQDLADFEAQTANDLAGKADTGSVTALDSAVVKKTGNQQIDDVKTFTSPPVVPDNSFAIAKTSGLQTALDSRVLKYGTPYNIGATTDELSPSLVVNATVMFRAPATARSRIKNVRINAAATGTVQLKAMNEGATSATKEGSDMPVTVAQTGWHTIDVSALGYTVKAGQLIAAYGNGILRTKVGTTGPAYSISSTGSGNVDTVPTTSSVTNTKILLGFELEPLVIESLADDLSTSTAAIADIEDERYAEKYGTPFTIGATATEPSPSNIANITLAHMDMLPVKSRLKTLRVDAAAAATVKLKEMVHRNNELTKIGSDIDIVIPSTGWQEIDVRSQNIIFNRGSSPALYGFGTLRVKLNVAGEGAGYVGSISSPASGNVDTITITDTNTVISIHKLLWGFEWEPLVTAQISEDLASSTAITTAAAVGYQAIGRPELTGGTVGNGLDFTFIQLDTSDQDGMLDELNFQSNGNGIVRFKVWAGTSQVGEDIILPVKTGFNYWNSLDFGDIPVLKGQQIALYAYPLSVYKTVTADGSGFGHVGSGNRTSGTVTVSSPTVQVQWGAKVRYDRVAAVGDATQDYISETVTDASLAIDGMDVTPSVQIVRDGTAYTFPGSPVTLTAAPSGMSRYDLVTFNSASNTFEIVEGTADAMNSQHASCMPVPENSAQIELFRVRVADGVADAVAVPRWRVFDGIDARVEEETEEGVERSRKCLAPIHKRIRNGDTLHIVFFGDSQTAHSDANPSNPAIPNGPNRDVATAPTSASLYYFRQGYSAAVCDAVPLYSAVQNGWADDGIGTNHTREGWHWGIAKAIMAEHDYVLTGGTPLLKVDNYSRAGWSTANAFEVDGVTPTAWLAAALASGAHFFVVAHGQNELNNAASEARFVRIAQLAQAEGMSVMFIGTPLDGDASVTGWQFTQRALERAAKFTNSAYVPTVHLYDQRFQGVGLAKADYCAANKFGVRNHAGFEEFELITSLANRIVLP
jgi:hypothetical protein